MSKTISFVATEELAEWIEEESERRMTTISSTAQQLLAEKYREEQGDESSESQDTGDSDKQPRVVSTGSDSDGSDDGGGSHAFVRHPNKWYRPDGGHEYAVECSDGKTRYYKTGEGARKRLRDDYD